MEKKFLQPVHPVEKTESRTCHKFDTEEKECSEICERGKYKKKNMNLQNSIQDL